MALRYLIDGPVFIERSGASDIIAQYDENHGVLAVVEELGSMRRCGGQGDILAGCMGVTMHWALQVLHFALTSHDAVTSVTSIRGVRISQLCPL